MKKRIIFLLTLSVVFIVSVSSANTELYLYEDWSNSPQGYVDGYFDGLTFKWECDDIVIDKGYVTINAIGDPNYPEDQEGGGFWTFARTQGMMQDVLINKGTTVSFEINGDTNEPDGDFALVALHLSIKNVISNLSYIIAGEQDLYFKNIVIGPGTHTRNIYNDLVSMGMNPDINERIYVSSIIGTTVASGTSTAWSEFGYIEINSEDSPIAEFTFSPDVPFNGQEISFDASASRPQENITTYE